MGNSFTPDVVSVGPNASQMANLTPSDDYGDIRLCLDAHEVTSCARIGIAVTLSLLTGISSIIKAVHLHVRRHKIYQHYCVLYSAALQAGLLAVHWLVYLERAAVLDFIVTYILACQILVMCHHYCGWAAASLHHDKCFKLFTIPVIVLVGLYFTGVLIWAGISEEKNRYECHGHQWIMFSASNLVLCQLFLVAGVYITRVLVHVHNKDKRLVILQVWGIIAGYELSTLAAFGYDLYLKISAPQNCSQIFSSDKGVYVVVFLLHRTLKYLVPAWSAVLWIHHHRGGGSTREGYLTVNDHSDNDSINWARSKDFKSTFLVPQDPGRRPLLRPSSPLAVDPSLTPAGPPPTEGQQQRTTPRSQGYGSGPSDHRPENPTLAFGSRGSATSSYDSAPPLYSAHGHRGGSSGYASAHHN